MPLFVFLSGYLLNTNRISYMSFTSLVSKYWDRMIKQWLLALLVYSSIEILSKDISLSIIVSLLLKPYYHLWYIPVLLIMILTVWMISMNIKTQLLKVCIYAFLGLTLCGIYNYYYDLLSHYRLHFFVFFFLGVLCKDYQNIFSRLVTTRRRLLFIRNVGRGILFLTFVAMFYLVGMSYSDFRIYFMTPFNLYLCIWIVFPFILTDSLRSKSLEYMGHFSLEIYLWHVIPILILKKLVVNPFEYYCIITGIIIIAFTIISYKQIKYENDKTIFDSRNGRELL